jgi:hypothetical protein
MPWSLAPLAKWYPTTCATRWENPTLRKASAKQKPTRLKCAQALVKSRFLGGVCSRINDVNNLDHVGTCRHQRYPDSQKVPALDGMVQCEPGTPSTQNKRDHVPVVRRRFVTGIQQTPFAKQDVITGATYQNRANCRNNLTGRNTTRLSRPLWEPNPRNTNGKGSSAHEFVKLG